MWVAIGILHYKDKPKSCFVMNISTEDSLVYHVLYSIKYLGWGFIVMGYRNNNP